MTLNDPIDESLFADLTEGVLASDYVGLNWSYSRREALEHCTRRYFYQYYSEALKDPRLRARVLFLKSVKEQILENRRTRAPCNRDLPKETQVEQDIV